jgi:hypothetical protein
MSQEEINRFVAHLFDKGPPTTWLDTVPLPYSDDNPPPSVRITVLLLTFFLTINTFLCLVSQNLYPDREIDVALSDEDNIRLNEPVGDDVGGNRAPSAEALAPNPIRSNSAGETHPSAVSLEPKLHQRPPSSLPSTDRAASPLLGSVAALRRLRLA